MDRFCGNRLNLHTLNISCNEKKVFSHKTIAINNLKMNINSEEFHQIACLQNERAKDLVATKLINEIIYKLSSFPFNYEMDASRKVASGIILFGDEIYNNAKVETLEDEAEKEDIQLVQINNLGKHFSCLLPLCILEIVSTNKEVSSALENKKHLYIISDNIHRFVKKHPVSSFIEYMTKLKEYIQEYAFGALTFCLQSLIPMKDNEIIFENDFTVPKNVVVDYIQDTFRNHPGITPINIHICFASEENLEIVSLIPKTSSEKSYILSA